MGYWGNEVNLVIYLSENRKAIIQCVKEKNGKEESSFKKLYS